MKAADLLTDPKVWALTLGALFLQRGRLEDRSLFVRACELDGPLPKRQRRRSVAAGSPAPCGPCVSRVPAGDIRPQMAGKILTPAAEREGVTIDERLEDFAEFAVEWKFDGERWFLASGSAWNRSGKPGEFPHLQGAIPEGVVLDGEIVNAADPVGSTCHQVATLRRSNPEGLGFVAFDVVEWQGEDVTSLPWSERREFLDSIAADLVGLSGGQVTVSEVFPDARELFDRARDCQAEGVVLKNRQSRYKAGNRSAWIKWKLSDDHDVVVTNCNGPSTVEGHVGLSYGFYGAGGKLRTVGTLGVTGPLQEMAPHVGSVAVVRSYGQQYDSGALRHPTLIKFRDDKCATECVFNFNNQEGSK